VARDGGEHASRLEKLVAGATPAPIDRFVVKEKGRLVFVAVETVDWICHAGRELRALLDT
jgi:hypothetical protein